MKKPQIASLAQVKITKQGTCAIIEYKDSSIPTVHFEMGISLQGLTEQEILDKFNLSLNIQQEMAAEYKHIAREIPPGKPQIKYDRDVESWIPNGDVLRCVIDDGGPDYEVSIIIDEHELSLSEFGKLLLIYNGWGMRLVFVPEDEITRWPRIKMQDISE